MIHLSYLDTPKGLFYWQSLKTIVPQLCGRFDWIFCMKFAGYIGILPRILGEGNL